jgi:hypothetical protein
MDIESIINKEFNGLGSWLNIYHIHDTFHVTFICNSGEQTNFNIDLHSREIYINYLSKCEDVKGKIVLSKIIKIAKKIAPIKIKLIDVSKILFENNFCYFDLAIFNILLKGCSWYNNFGFISENYNDEKQKNNLIRNIQINTFFKLVIESNITSPKEIKKHLKYIEENRLSENLTLMKYFKFLCSNFFDINEDQCNHNSFILLNDIINISSSFIHYDRELFMNVEKNTPIHRSTNLDFLQNKGSMII